LSSDWPRLADEVWVGLAEWRARHPRATWREIEAALDERLAGLRARLLQDLALTSAAAEPATAAPPACPTCGHPMQGAGRFTRHVTTHHGHDVTLQRGYTRCPVCRTGLFPPR